MSPPRRHLFLMLFGVPGEIVSSDREKEHCTIFILITVPCVFVVNMNAAEKITTSLKEMCFVPPMKEETDLD